MRTEEENIYLALVTEDLTFFIICHRISILHLGLEMATDVVRALCGNVTDVSALRLTDREGVEEMLI